MGEKVNTVKHIMFLKMAVYVCAVEEERILFVFQSVFPRDMPIFHPAILKQLQDH